MLANPAGDNLAIGEPQLQLRRIEVSVPQAMPCRHGKVPGDQETTPKTPLALADVHPVICARH
jgi:hypothetical protein